MTLSGGPSASRVGVTSVVADFDAVDDRNADERARKGRKAEAGLAVENGSVTGGNHDGLKRAYPA